MSNELSPSEMAWTRYRHALGEGAVTFGEDATRARIVAFLAIHSVAWRRAAVELRSAFPGGPFEDEGRERAQEASMLEHGMEAVFDGSVPQRSERVGWAMFGDYLDWVEAPDTDKPYLTLLTSHIGSQLYHALPVSADSLPDVSLSVASMIDFDFDDMDFGSTDENDDRALRNLDELEFEDSDDAPANLAHVPWARESNDPWVTVAPASEKPREMEPGAITGLHYAPVLESDPVQGAHTHGGFFPSDWARYLSLSQSLTNGVWVVNRFPVEGKLALHFFGERYSAFAEIFQEHIADARVAAKGFNLVVEIRAADDATFVAVGPRRRMRVIFKELGFSL